MGLVTMRVDYKNIIVNIYFVRPISYWKRIVSSLFL